jgi:hypothetical protein
VIGSVARFTTISQGDPSRRRGQNSPRCAARNGRSICSASDSTSRALTPHDLKCFFQRSIALMTMRVSRAASSAVNPNDPHIDIALASVESAWLGSRAGSFASEACLDRGWGSDGSALHCLSNLPLEGAAVHLWIGEPG